MQALEAVLDDESPSVQIVAAEILCKSGFHRKALDVLRMNLEDERDWLALQAAASIRNLGTAARPLLPAVRRVLEKYSGDVWGRYASWLYPMFIGFALEQTMINLGENI
jgi:uncharacterized sulfatase